MNDHCTLHFVCVGPSCSSFIFHSKRLSLFWDRPVEFLVASRRRLRYSFSKISKQNDSNSISSSIFRFMTFLPSSSAHDHQVCTFYSIRLSVRGTDRLVVYDNREWILKVILNLETSFYFGGNKVKYFYHFFRASNNYSSSEMSFFSRTLVWSVINCDNYPL